MSIATRLSRSLKRPTLVQQVFRGDNVECPCCGSCFRRFRDRHAPNRECWRCRSLERHRALWLFLTSEPDFLAPGMSILHVAPEPALSQHLKAIPRVDYVAGDVEGRFGPERIDVTKLLFADSTFDAVICNHVLEHVPEDTVAMREIFRVLKPGGWAILQVPDVWTDRTDEDASVATAAERARRFGQADHVRQYGWDYPDRLTIAGFQVQVSRGEGIFTPKMIDRHRLKKFGEIEPIFLARRPLSDG